MVFHLSPREWFPVHEAQTGISEAALLRPGVVPARWDSVFQGCHRDPLRLLPTDRSLAFVKASRYLEPEKQLNQVFHLFRVCWLTY